MKIIYQRITIVVLLFCFFSAEIVAQRANGLAVEGKINVQQGSVDGAIIQMFQDGRRMDNYGVGADGNYKVELNYNHKFELIFSRPDNFPQKIVVETAVPQNILQTNPSFPPFPLDINLFAEIPGIDRRFSENTVLKIYYSPNVDNFISELYYNDAQIAKLIEQAVLQSQLIGKEADYLSKLTRAELAELRKEYNQLLEQAGKEYSDEKFLAALDGFKAASKIFPNEQFPKDRIAEINDLLGLMMVSAELDKALAERYTALIEEADGLFNVKEYTDARNSYNRALSIKPNEAYPNAQIQLINDLLKQQQGEEQYNELIAVADNSFKQLLYNDALTKYQEALQIKNNEVYPKNKIEEINTILAKQTKDAEKQENYKQAMLQGEAMFEKQFYDKSIASFETALKLQPGDEPATQRIADVKAIMTAISNKMQFDELVKSADKFFKKQQLDEALSDYSKAADLISTNDYVNKQIDRIIAAQNLDEQYNAAIAQADENFAIKNYEDSKVAYAAATALKPKEKYPKDKIAEINGILQQLAKTDADYQKAIAKADGLFQQKDYEKAKTAFADAGILKPAETYPPEMVGKIDVLLAEQAQIAAESEAERLRLEQEAAAAEAARLAAIQAEKDKNYSEAIAKADNLFDTKEYDNARNEYRVALNVKPEETYPQNRIDEIGTLMAQLSAAQKAYEDAVKIGDREFAAEKFDAAKTAFNTAKQAKADESYPVEMIAKIDSITETRARLAAESEAERLRLEQEAAAAEAARLAAIQAEKDKNYSEAITKADNFFDTKEYENARNEYRVALSVKPEETYPQTRIDEIGTLMAQLSAAQKAYEDAVKIGDREFAAEGFDAAKTAFNTAIQAKADESYPVEMIAKIDSITETRARLAAESEAERLRLEQEAAAAEAARLAAIQAEKDKNYSEAIAKADNLFDTKEYDNARNEYRVALSVKPEETYPQTRIDEIGTLMADLVAAKKEQELLDKNYLSLIQQADRFFTAKNYGQSKEKYNEALVLKPEEAHPQERITEIDQLLEQQALDEKYRTIIVAADAFFKTENYLQAKTEYENALLLKSAEQYPKSQISKIDDILAKEQQRILAEKQAAEDMERRSNEIAKMNEEIASRGVESEAELNVFYNELIKQADVLFDTKLYNVSRGWYYKAWDVKPKEKYPQQRIDEINRLVGSLLLSQLDRDYQKFVDLADSTFRENQYALARGWYNRALGVKGNEKYPKDQLAEIEKKIAERLVGQSGRQFEINVEKASAAFETKNYNVARFWYKKALELRPNDADVNQKLQEISDALK